MEKYKIDFEKAHQKYSVTDKEVVGVTTATGQLEKYGLHYYYYDKGVKGIDFNKPEPSATIGTIAHAKIMCELKGLELDKSNITPEQDTKSDSCLTSYHEWIKDKIIKPVWVEKQLTSKIYGYGGTLDFLGYVNDELQLWDYKSGKDIYEEYITQISPYNNLAVENKKIPKRLLIINIPKTGDSNFKIASYDPESIIIKLHFKKFLHCVDIWNDDFEIKNYKKNGEIINTKDNDFYNYVQKESK